LWTSKGSKTRRWMRSDDDSRVFGAGRLDHHQGPPRVSRLNATVRDLARDLPVGGSRSGLVCPKCGGGQSGEPSFSVTVGPEGIWYKCHRASCGLGGLRSGLEPGRPTDPAPFEPRPYPHNLATPPDGHWIWPKLGIEAGSLASARLGVYTRFADPDEIVWEVRDFDLKPRGHISRAYSSKFIRSWRTEPGPWMGFFRGLCPRLWIVEDMVSAAKISLAGFPALALLGTHLSPEGRAELGAYLRRLNAPVVRVALDPDAAAKGSALARDLTFRLGRDTIFVPLSQDPKDLTRAELAEVLKT